MIEIASTLLEHMAATISKRGYGEKKVLIYITAGVILFFKPLVLKLYNYLIHPSLLFFSLLMIVLISLGIYRHTKDERIDLSNRVTCKLAFLILGLGIGYVVNWISNLFIPTPNMSEFFKTIEGTTRLGWLHIIFQWDNFTASLYFIFYFVSLFYLVTSFCRAVRDIDTYTDGLSNEIFLTNMTTYSAVMIVLVRTNIAYWILSFLFSLLQ